MNLLLSPAATRNTLSLYNIQEYNKQQENVNGNGSNIPCPLRPNATRERFTTSVNALTLDKGPAQTKNTFHQFHIHPNVPKKDMLQQHQQHSPHKGGTAPLG